MTSKEALVKLYNAIDENLLYEQNGIIFSIDLYNLIKKELEKLEQLEKAIKILKLRNVDIERLLIHKNAKQYNKGVYYEFCLSEEEFKLLRGVLENDNK